MMKCMITAIIVFVVSISAEHVYAPLVKAQKKLFTDSYAALIQANQDGNDMAFIMFAPGVLTRYESILLDPNCTELRPAYNEIKVKYKLIKMSSIVDSIECCLNQTIISGNFPEIIKLSSSLLNILQENNMVSLFAGYQKKIDSLILSNYHDNTDVAVYSSIIQLPFVSQYVLDSLRIYLETTKRDVLTKLSANLDYNEIATFQSNYPTLFSDEIPHLKDMAQSNLKNSAIHSAQKGDVQALIDYRDKFGNDIAVNKILERSLYSAFMRYQTEENASKYLMYFPNSNRAETLKDFLRTITKQDELNELAKKILIQKYGERDADLSGTF